MATKRMQLAVNTPCQQRWQDMTPAEAGRFCDSCQKTVVDFSGLTDQQIANIVRQSTGSTCGRFRESQLNRALYVSTSASYSPRRFFSLLTAGLLGYQTVQADVRATTFHPSASQTDQLSVGMVDQPATESDTTIDSSRVITGRVVDKVTNTGLGGAFVIVKNASRGANSDSTGSFRLMIPADIGNELITLQVGQIGFITQEIEVHPDQANLLLIVLQQDEAALNQVFYVGEYIAKGYKKQSLFKRLRSRGRRNH